MAAPDRRTRSRPTGGRSAAARGWEPADAETANTFARYKDALQVERELRGPVKEKAVEELRRGAEVGDLAHLTGMTAEVFRRLAREHDIDPTRPGTAHWAARARTPSSPEPAKDLADKLRARIDQDQDLALLPSVAALMREYEVSRLVVNAALALLAGEGRVISQRGIGWIVRRDTGDRRPLVDRMDSLITERNLQPGDRYPSMTELCALLGEKQPAVREALAELEEAGVLRRARGRLVVD